MRNLLLAGAAVAGVCRFVPAEAQTSLPTTYTQGQVATTSSATPPASANNNNNTHPGGVPGPVANPTPGTVVIHINGRVVSELTTVWSSLDKGSFPAITGVGGATLVPAGNFKIQPTVLANYARLYTGVDGQAANGLRYGGAIEIRENVTGQTSSSSSTGASGFSSSETLFVRRAFAYIASDQIGILRVGQVDGLIGLYDAGVTTFDFLTSGNLANGDVQATAPGGVQVPFAFLSLVGAEYANTKIVYLSPQFHGFDFGLQWAPNTSNGFAAGTGTTFGAVAGCSFASSGCPGLSSSTVPIDGSRILNQTAVGARYQGLLGDIGVLAYGVYEFSGHTNFTGPVTPPGASRFDSLSFGSAGIALTYAGFTVGGNYIGGAVNGQGALRPTGGAGTNGVLLGALYKTGPLTLGVVGESIASQGAPSLTGKTQRQEYAFDVGGNYYLAPGLSAWTEYTYQQRKQNGFNFATGATGTAFNQVQSQGAQIGTTVYW